MRVELDVRQPVVLPPGEGDKLLSDEVTITEWLGEASATPHIHRAHLDVFYVIDGELDFAGTSAPAGSLGYAPPDVVHWFVARDGRYLNIHAPGAAWARRIRARNEGRRPTEDAIDTYEPPDGPMTSASLVLPHDGEQLTSEQRAIRIKIARPEICLFEFKSSAGHTGPPPHIHLRHVDAFYVLDGELEFFLGGDTIRATAGMFVAAPPGVVHTFANRGPSRARFLNLHAPGMGFDEYFRRMAAGEEGRAFHEAFDQHHVA